VGAVPRRHRAALATERDPDDFWLHQHWIFAGDL
jgi:hypothetical protein